MFRLKTYTPSQPKAKFYIQAKGEHSGRPLKNPIPNCFSVYTDNEILFSLVYALYIGDKFKPHICGSVVPFIKIDDAKKIITENLIFESNSHLFIKIEKVDELKSNLKQQLNLLDQLQKSLCYKALKQE